MSTPKALDFDQTERITHRLRLIVRGYPKGLGLIKEFLQNADDAGARSLRVIYDCRSHPGELATDEQAVALGPALLFINDRPFTEQDFKNIQAIGSAGKLREAGRSGRFGLGFNTSFSVSDHPSLMTAHWVAWFDPHHRAHTGHKNAHAWNLSDVESAWPDWLQSFSVAGWQPGMKTYPGAAFRLPLRSEEEAKNSEISDAPFTLADFENLLTEAERVGPALLVFLRCVQELIIESITPEGRRRTRFHLKTANSEEVEAKRAPLREAVTGDPVGLLHSWGAKKDPLPTAIIRHDFVVANGNDTHSESWAVVSGLYCGSDDLLLKAALELDTHGEKVIPWAGAAVRVDSPEESVAEGGLACFLPLPVETKWPVWLHGWFDLDEARRGITCSEGRAPEQRRRFDWNKALLQHGVGPAWASLVFITRDSVQERPYRHWPTSSATEPLYKELIKSFYSAIVQYEVIRCAGLKGLMWCRPGEPFISLPQKWQGRLQASLTEGGLKVALPPLPSEVYRGLNYRADPRAEVRRWLSDMASGTDVNCALDASPSPALSCSEWVIALAEFCAGGDLKRLRLLPLALLADGRLHTFCACGALYLLSDEMRQLFADLPEHRLDPVLQGVLGVDTPIAELDIRNLGVSDLVDCVRAVMQRRRVDDTWMIALFDHLESLPPELVRKKRALIKKLVVVPDRDGQHHRLQPSKAPLLALEHPPELIAAISALGIPIVGGSLELLQSISKFARRHPGFIESLTVKALADRLEENALEAYPRPDVHRPLLDFLASSAHEVRYLDELKNCRILPAQGGAFCCSTDERVFAPGSFCPPDGIEGPVHVLDPGVAGCWRPLYSALGVLILDGSLFIQNVVIPYLPKASAIMQDRVLRWLGDELPAILAGLKGDDAENLRRLIRRAPIVPTQHGALRPAIEVYSPTAKPTLKLLGDVAPVPDPARFSEGASSWKGLFATLQFRQQPRGPDLLEAVKRCSESGLEDLKKLEELREHILGRWSALTKPKSGGAASFAPKLAQIAWLEVASLDPKEVAGAKGWETPLAAPKTLVSSRLKHIVSSQERVVKFRLSEDDARALGVRSSVPLGTVRAHLEVIRDLVTGEALRPALLKATAAFVQYVADLVWDDEGPISTEIRSIALEPCLFLRGRWWCPAVVFREPLPFSTPSGASIMEEPGLAKRLDSLEVGLRRLGVRDAPPSEHWVRFLSDLATQSKRSALSEVALAQARLALGQLAGVAATSLQQANVYVVTDDGRLEAAKTCFIQDDARIRLLGLRTQLSLVEQNAGTVMVARLAGAQSLQAVLLDRLGDTPSGEHSDDARRWINGTQEKLRDPSLREALCRLAYDQAIAEGVKDPESTVVDARLRVPLEYELRLAATLTVHSVMPGSGSIVFVRDDAPSFIDKERRLIWILETHPHKMTDELVRALSELSGVRDTLRLWRVLEASSGSVEALLDDEGVVQSPAKASEYDLVPDLEADGWDAEEQAFHQEDDDHWFHQSSEQDADLDADGHEPQAEEDSTTPPRTEHGPGYPSEGESSVGPRESGGAPQWRGRLGPSAGGESTRRQLGASPASRSNGSSRPWTQERGQDERSRNEGRLRSYAHNERQADYDAGSADHIRSVGRAAEDIVQRWEIDHGREVTVMPPGHPGYDLQSNGPAGRRYIEVKGTGGAWTALGVGLSRTQFRSALEHRQAWWLYVVEFAMEPSRARVLPINNPILAAQEYRIDSGWRGVADVEPQDDPTSPQVGQKVSVDAQSAEVVAVENFGTLWIVTLVFEDGSQDERTWNPSWLRS